MAVDTKKEQESVAKTMCNGISVTQILENKNRMLGGPKKISFDIDYNGKTCSILIDQIGRRVIKIGSEIPIDVSECFEIFNQLDMLLMLMDGEFLKVKKTRILVSGEEIESQELQQLTSERVSFFRSADYTRGKHSTFIEFDQVLDSQLFESWHSIREELDILHNMVLYSMSATGMTIDVKCAFLIEAFEALAELVAEKNNEYQLPRIAKGESKLGKRMLSLIELYGMDIFKEELSMGIENVVQIFVNSRNRIAHIKSKQDKKYLSGKESVLYAVKISYLYRRILIELLGIDYALYSDKVIKAVNAWNQWNNILDEFKIKVNND